MKTVIVTPEDTDVLALAKVLNQEQIEGLFYNLIQLNKVCIPQFYSSDDHAKYYGFKHLKDMNRKTSHYYEHIDADMFILAE